MTARSGCGAHGPGCWSWGSEPELPGYWRTSCLSFLPSNPRTACVWMRLCWWSSCCRRSATSSTHTAKATSTPLSSGCLLQPSSSLWAATTSMPSSAASPPGNLRLPADIPCLNAPGQLSVDCRSSCRCLIEASNVVLESVKEEPWLRWLKGTTLLFRLQELTVCSEDNVDVHDIELMQYINVDCSKLKRLLQGWFPWWSWSWNTLDVASKAVGFSSSRNGA